MRLEVARTITTIIFVVAVYLLPWIVAKIRKSDRSAQIALINIFLGWSLIGWIVALVMAVGKNKK